MTPYDWIISGDTGISSKTIWAVMMGASDFKRPFGFDTPHDPQDFGRCYRLLKHFPAWRERLSEVSDRFFKWGPMVREWDRMTEIYERDLESGSSPELFALMRELEEEGMLADGWVKTGPGAWERTGKWTHSEQPSLPTIAPSGSRG